MLTLALAMNARVMMFELTPAGVHRPPSTAPNMIAIIKALPKLLLPGLASMVFSKSEY